VVAIIGSLSCANVGYTGGNIFELLKCVGVCLIYFVGWLRLLDAARTYFEKKPFPEKKDSQIP